MELQKKLDIRGMEAAAREHLAGVGLAAALARRGGPEEAFVEGPPTMNGEPHAGHLRGRVIKDYWYRYATLRGRRVSFAAGWDAQGLPVELQAQKEIGAEGGRRAIEEAGVERLVAGCKDLVRRSHESWARVDGLLGVSLDQEAAYWTHRDGFIEREWQFLKRANEAGVLEDDRAVIAYCPGCQTSLSHAEVGQGYEEVADPSVYYKARLAGEDASLVVWTTMPFTLVTDAMVGVDPDEDYHYVRAGGETLVVGASRLEAVAEEAGVGGREVLKTVRGSELEGRRYEHPLLGRIPALGELSRGKGYHTVVAEGFVDAGAGSGLVHLSPANGEDDHRAAARRGIPVFCPIDDEARFTSEAGDYAGMFVRDADGAVTAHLREAGALVHAGKVRHKYPLCWRSRHRIVWLARRGWFYKLDRLGGMAEEAAAAVDYFYEQPRNRFLAIVGERHPWCISRERYWGCPLPAWNCADCGNRDWHYSRGEIVAAAAELPDGPGFELHRPWIDRVRLRCGRCGGTNTSREPYVLDTWHNSGAAPFASADDARYAESVPVPFLTEGIDQTRGWAYTLLVLNVIMRGAPEPPYRSFLFQGHVLDGKGRKMSKSLGNVTGAGDLLSRHPADLVRLYLLRKASPIEPLSLDEAEIGGRPFQVVSTLYHLHAYSIQNGAYDGLGPGHTVAWARERGLLRPPEAWLLSRLQGLAAEVAGLNDRCRLHEAVRAVESFAVDDMSKTYLPATRQELWDDGAEGRDRRLAIHAVMRHALLAADAMLHPACPFATEYLYRCAGGRKESVLLEGWPEPDGSLKDPGAEESFGLLAEAASVAAAARMRAGLKRRWPLDRAIVCVRRGGAAALGRLGGLLREQLNVEEAEVREVSASGGPELALELHGAGLPAAPTVKLDRAAVGPRAGRLMGEVAAAVAGADPAGVARALAGGGVYRVPAGGGEFELGAGDLEVGFEAAEGFAAASRGGVTVFVPSSRSREATARGLVRDVARRLQALRKELGHDPAEVLGTASVLGLGEEQLGLLRGREAELASLVRVRRVDFGGACSSYRDGEVDGQSIRIAVER